MWTQKAGNSGVHHQFADNKSATPLQCGKLYMSGCQERWARVDCPEVREGLVELAAWLALLLLLRRKPAGQQHFLHKVVFHTPDRLILRHGKV